MSKCPLDELSINCPLSPKSLCATLGAKLESYTLAIRVNGLCPTTQSRLSGRAKLGWNDGTRDSEERRERGLWTGVVECSHGRNTARQTEKQRKQNIDKPDPFQAYGAGSSGNWKY